MIKRILSSINRKVALFLVNKVFCGTRPSYYPIKRKLLNNVGFVIGSNTRVVGPIICTGHLSIGEDVFIGANFCVRGNGSVNIGSYVDIGPDVTFLTGSHKISDYGRRAGEGYNSCINILDNCWIGGKSCFVNDITVGEGSVVAACACVCKNVDSNTLVGGVPARRIKDL